MGTPERLLRREHQALFSCVDFALDMTEIHFAHEEYLLFHIWKTGDFCTFHEKKLKSEIHPSNGYKQLPGLNNCLTSSLLVWKLLRDSYHIYGLHTRFFFYFLYYISITMSDPWQNLYDYFQQFNNFSVKYLILKGARLKKGVGEL